MFKLFEHVVRHNEAFKEAVTFPDCSCKRKSPKRKARVCNSSSYKKGKKKECNIYRGKVLTISILNLTNILLNLFSSYADEVAKVY